MKTADIERNSIDFEPCSRKFGNCSISFEIQIVLDSPWQAYGADY